ncbi:NOL1/NOP2/SUN family protein [Gregarina niphandrodes]|uniref:NOL1/NOP2/Sun domain family member 4 n=1 Tax=Gregarina niphandrodes TaxID=110365 RepID=A0A023BDJ4_GRENI|nr:NOL1/NOP2/SUN family protein [Gregarina niphandrodes]EZG88108.1 NOL1/NOP2/SUN family protein [Gregarina niphandrodes]|eukprot:XP_011128625.1 NOL1/NOP2/SUN family protein [Gregarina niphandrodes]
MTKNSWETLNYDYYGGVLWPNLREHLKTPPKLHARISQDKSAQSADNEHRLFGHSCFIKQQRYVENTVDYFIDPASVFPVAALNVKDGCSVLDMCAAPGGKSLLIAGELFHHERRSSEDCDSFLVCNDLSQARLQRLQRNLAAHHGSDKRQYRVTISDPSTNSRVVSKYAPYDCVLLDAPCSSDRHRIAVDPLMKEWSLQSVKRTVKLQKQLLKTGLEVLKRGGRLVYSTCALSELENDLVLESAFVIADPVPHDTLLQQLEEKCGIDIRVVELRDPPAHDPPAHDPPTHDRPTHDQPTHDQPARAEMTHDGTADGAAALQNETAQQNELPVLTLRKTTYGFLMLPCDQGGIGVIYFAALQKRDIFACKR